MKWNWVNWVFSMIQYNEDNSRIGEGRLCYANSNVMSRIRDATGPLYPDGDRICI